MTATERNPLVASGEYVRTFAGEVETGDYVAETERRVRRRYSAYGRERVGIEWHDGTVSYFRRNTTLLVRAKGLPYPGVVFYDGNVNGRVIASVYLDDTDEPVRAMLLLLTEDEPFYLIVDVFWREGGWSADEGTLMEFENIVPAVDYWQQSGGDY